MNDKKNLGAINDSELLRNHLKKSHRQERYLFCEKVRRNLSYDRISNWIADEDADIIDTIIRKHLHIALIKALRDLDCEERRIIDEVFFREKRSYTELAKLHNLSRQGYSKNVDRILKKMKVMIQENYEDF